MATISSGSVTITINAGEQYRFVASGEAYLDIGGGSTQSYRLINGASERLLGGFIVATPVTVRVVSGSVDYGRIANPVQNGLTDEQIEAGATGVAGVTADGEIIIANGTKALQLAPVYFDDTTKASENVAIIQSIVNDGGCFIAGNGVVWVDGSILMGDNSRLIGSETVTLKQVNGNNQYMLSNSQLEASASSVTLTYTDSSIVSVAWSAHTLAVGDVIVLQGSTQKQFDTTARVITVTDANNVVCQLPFMPSSAPTGTITAKRCNRNIKVNIKLDYNYTNNNTATAYNRMAAIFGFICDSHIEVEGFNVFKYVLEIAGADNVTGGAKGYPYSHSDTVKVYGPANRVDMYAEGLAPEDTCSFQTKEPAAYIAYQPSFGAIRNSKYTRVRGLTTGGSGAFVIYSDDTYEQTGLVISDSELASSFGPALQITPGSGFDRTLSKIGDVRVKNSIISGSSSSPSVLVRSALSTLIFDTCAFNIKTLAATGKLVLVDGSASFGKVVLKNIKFDATGLFTANTSLFETAGTVAIGEIVFENCDFKGAGFARLLNIGSTSTVKTVRLVNCKMQNMAAIVLAIAAGVHVVIDGGEYVDCEIIANYRANGTLTLLGSPVFTNASSGVVKGEQTAVIDVYASTAPRLTGTSIFHSVINTATLNIKSDAISIDIGATGIAKAAGNRAFNTGSGRGTITQNRPVVCDGTAWYNATNLSQTY